MITSAEVFKEIILDKIKPKKIVKGKKVARMFFVESWLFN